MPRTNFREEEARFLPKTRGGRIFRGEEKEDDFLVHLDLPSLFQTIKSGNFQPQKATEERLSRQEDVFAKVKPSSQVFSFSKSKSV